MVLLPILVYLSGAALAIIGTAFYVSSVIELFPRHERKMVPTPLPMPDHRHADRHMLKTTMPYYRQRRPRWRNGHHAGLPNLRPRQGRVQLRRQGGVTQS
ncbi:hypothetical protein B5X24_HaOG207219 [Helicoverpa armigera]|nr:hypothetical protein B5X24_HaOG207219 [Helicoverpa armigera]